MKTVWLALGLTLTALSGCSAAEDPIVIQSSAPSEVLDAEERFETVYTGNWSETGGCGADEIRWEIHDDLIKAGDRSCMIADVESSTSLLEAELIDCWAEGEPVPDRNIALDVAGTDILYLTTSEGRRLRLERCDAD